MIPPTPDSLKAMAGWALSQLGGASNAQAVALHHFKEGCGELAENFPAPAVTCVRPQRDVSTAPSKARAAATSPRIVVRRQDIGRVEQLDCRATGEHRFSIRTQCCVWCGESYRKVRGRKPELM